MIHHLWYLVSHCSRSTKLKEDSKETNCTRSPLALIYMISSYEKILSARQTSADSVGSSKQL